MMHPMLQSGFVLIMLSMPLQAAPAVEFGKQLCRIIEGYHQGSLHYFDCLNHLETMAPDLNEAEVIESVCGAVHTFWNLEDKSFEQRCFSDGRSKRGDAAVPHINDESSP